jgi:hypothetical protein
VRVNTQFVHDSIHARQGCKEATHVAQPLGRSCSARNPTLLQHYPDATVPQGLLDWLAGNEDMAPGESAEAKAAFDE